MLKILRHEFSSSKTFQPMFYYYRRYPKKWNVVQQYNGCNVCYSSQLCYKINRPSDFLKGKVTNHYNFCKLTTKASQETIIEQQTEANTYPKQFAESESIYHHKILEDSNVYDNTLFKKDSTDKFIQQHRLSHEEFKDLISTRDWGNKSPTEIATAFISFGIYSDSNLMLTMDDPQFNELTAAFVNKCTEFTEDQLIDCMIAVQIWPQSIHVKENNYLKIWKSLDNACYERYLDWSVDKKLYMMDLWYHMRLLRLSKFVFKGLNKISTKSSDLTRAQMIQTMFYMSCVRKLHPQISLREYEHYLQKHITHLTIGEIGIFTLAFFKTQTSILNEKLLLYTMQRVVEEVNTIPEVTLVAIAKALRFSFKPELAFTINDMVKKITEQRMSSLDILSCIHVAHITSKLQVYNEEALTKLAEKFCEDPSKARLKDMERVAFLLSLFNYIPPSTPDIMNTIVQQLDLPQHIVAGEDHPLTLISLVYFLTLQRTYHEKHIQHLLSKEFLNKYFENKFTTAVQILQIDYNRVLEGPKGSEHLLTPSMREYLARKNSMFTPDVRFKKLTNFDQMMIDVINLTKEVLGGEKYYLITYTLPHYPRADILFRLSPEGRPIPIPEELRSQKPFHDVIRPVGDGWRCVVVANRNMYMFNVPRLVGEASCKLRQLKLLGYKPVVIPFLYWMSEKNKVDYLKLKYFPKPK